MDYVTFVINVMFRIYVTAHIRVRSESLVLVEDLAEVKTHEKKNDFIPGPHTLSAVFQYNEKD